MKRIVYTCDRCGKEITADRYHITITRETDKEPEVIGESCYQDYCLECMTDAMAHLRLVDPHYADDVPEETEIAPEETITEHVPPEPEDMEEPEESVMCELREMDAEQRKRRKWLDPKIRDQIIDMYKDEVPARVISATLGVEKRVVCNTVQHAKEKGLI